MLCSSLVLFVVSILKFSSVRSDSSSITTAVGIFIDLSYKHSAEDPHDHHQSVYCPSISASQ